MSIEAAAATNQDHHRFVEGNVSEDLTCGVCRHAVRRAVQAPCGCRFCDVCISDKSVCPNCDEKFVEDEIAPDHHARRKISKARIYCPNGDRGCSETFALKELQRHLEFCEYFPVSCMHRSRGCTIKLARKDLQRHLKTECDHRSVECSFCKSAFPHREVDVHRRSCPKAQVACPNECGAEDVRRETLRTHLDERCSRQKRSCKFEIYGCDFKGVKEDLEKHAEEGVQTHLDMTVMAVTRLNMELSGAVGKVAELKSQMDVRLRKDRNIDELESRMKVERERNEELAAQVDSIKVKQKSKDDHLCRLQKLLAGQADSIVALEDTAKTNRKVSEDIRRTLDSVQVSTTELTMKVEGMEGNGRTGGGGRDSRLSLPTQQRISNMQKELDTHSVKLSDQDLRFQILETASYDGVLMWKIKDLRRRKQDADSGKTSSLYCQPFYTSRFGYKMCARIYLNGDGMGRGTHVSLFFVLMKGDYDALLKWPFTQKVTMMLLDQNDGKLNLSDSFRPDPKSSSFQRPKSDMNIASGCPLFVSQKILNDPVYVKDDTMFVKVIVDLTGLYV